VPSAAATAAAAQPVLRLPEPKGLMEGVLEKKSTLNRHNWQTRYFVLSRNSLSYYRDDKQRAAGKVQPTIILVQHIQSVEIGTSGKGSKEGKRLNVHVRLFFLFVSPHPSLHRQLFLWRAIGSRQNTELSQISV
jgi:hypothetical protein